MKNKPVTCLFLVLILFALDTFPQSNTIENPDTTKEKPTQYRRGIELNENYQSYEEKYAGKNLSEEKRSLFPLESPGVWTELNPKVPRVDYIGINFVNKDTGWAVGDLGALIKTTDGGESWSVSEANTTKPILKVRSFNGQIVIASGYDGLILRSTDGGETFTQVVSGVGDGFDLWGLEIVNDTLGWACGAAALLKTTDGGESWQIEDTPGYTGNLWWIDFMNKDYGLIAADGKVLRTTDGGNNWEIIQAGDGYPLFSIDVIDSLHIAAAGYGGTDYSAKNIYSSDGGDSWVNGGPTTTDPINCISYINTDTGYIAMSEVGLWKTTNRGQSWALLDSTSPNYVGEYEIQLFSRQNIGYDVGSGLRVYKADGNLDSWHKLILNDNFSDVFFTGENIGYAIAYRKVLKTNNGGEDWYYLSAFPTNEFTSSLNSLVFTDSVTGFAGGPPCKITKTTDAGNSWYVTNRTRLTDTIGTINKIFFINPTTGWAVTSRGGILKTTDAGENWFAQLNAGVSVGFNSIYFVDSVYGWVSGGRPYKTTDGGTNWIQQTNTSIWNSDDVYFQNIDTGWVGKYSSINNSLFKTTDSGLNWSAVPEVIGARKFYNFPDPIHWLIIGFSRYYITNDYGNDWLEFTEDVPVGLVSFNAPTNNVGFFVGNLGLILRYDDTAYVPVELTSFTAKVEGNNILLNWSTSSELNNRGFQIEKSFDKKNWFNLGFVEGNGTTTNLNYYSFIDNEINPIFQFYRLKQIDYDASFKYSGIIEVNSNLNILSFHLFQNYPNPFNSSTIIHYQVQEESFINISVYDIKGEKVIELVNDKKEKGSYKIELNNNRLPSGVYFIRMITSTGYSAVIKITQIK